MRSAAQQMQPVPFHDGQMQSQQSQQSQHGYQSSGGWDSSSSSGWDAGQTGGGYGSYGSYGSYGTEGVTQGAMSGRMAPAPSNVPVAAGSASIARNISSTLLGEGEPDEPPILEELGINFDHIKMKTRIVLMPKRSNITSSSPIVHDDDFAGPLLFCLVLGTLLLFKGKVQFGTIYAVFLIGLLGIYGVLNLMSHKGIGLTNTASVMGYSLLPIVFLAALSIPIDVQTLPGSLFIPATVLWCAYAASLLFVAALDADDRRWLFAYPVALFYTCFALITIF